MTTLETWIREQYGKNGPTDIEPLKLDNLNGDYKLETLNNYISDCYKKMETSKDKGDMRKYYTIIDYIRQLIQKNNLLTNDLQETGDTTSMAINQNDYYPDVNTGGDKFREKLFKHSEFKNCLYDNSDTVDKDSDNKHLVTMNSALFKNIYQRFPWQEFVKNYISPGTPYNSLMLWWDVGVGKTCGAVSIAEQFKEHIYNMGKKITVILPGSKLKTNWINEICGINMEHLDKQCTGDLYSEFLKGIDLSDTKNAKIRIKANISKFYNFVGYQELQNELERYISNTMKTTKTMRSYIKYLQRTYSDTLIIIDEVHQLRRDDKPVSDKEDNDIEEDEIIKKKSTKDFHDLIEDIIRHCTGIKLVIMSGTPMYDKWNEIMWLIDLLLKNDRRAPVIPYESNPDSIKNPGDYMDKLENELRLNITPYISYMSGENPITYPTKKYVANGSIESDTDKKFYIYEHNITVEQTDNAKKKFLYENFNGDINNYFNFKLKGNETKWSIDKVPDSIDLTKLAPKIKSIVNFVNKSEGIAFIYSEYLSYGVYPMAYALEMAGYTMAYINSDNVLSYRSILGKPRNINHKGHYILLTGDVSDSRLMKLIAEVNSVGNSGLSNINGEHIKVVLGSSKVEVGFSLKNVREVHIMEPWYNFSKTDQVIGRAFRSNSHKQLPKEERDVKVYYHVNKGESKSKEYYMRCIDKEKNINIIGNYVKANSIDYGMNYKQNFEKYGKKTDYKANTPINKDNTIISKEENDYRKFSSNPRNEKQGGKDKYPEPKQNNEAESICESLALRQVYTNRHYDFKTRLVQAYICDELFDMNYIYGLEDIKKKMFRATILLSFGFLKSDIGSPEKPGRFRYLYLALKNLVDNKVVFKNNYNIEGHLIFSNNYFVFQPTNLLESDAPLMYRTGKIDNLVDNIELKKIIVRKKEKPITTYNNKEAIIIIYPKESEVNKIIGSINIGAIKKPVSKLPLYDIQYSLLNIVELPILIEGANGYKYGNRGLEALFIDTFTYINDLEGENNIKVNKFKENLAELRNYFKEPDSIKLGRIQFIIDSDVKTFIFYLLCCIYGITNSDIGDKDFGTSGNNKSDIYCGHYKYIKIDDNDNITVKEFILLNSNLVYKYTYNNKKWNKKCIISKREYGINRNKRNEKTLAGPLPRFKNVDTLDAYKSETDLINKVYHIYTSYVTGIENIKGRDRINYREFNGNKIDSKKSLSVVCTSKTGDVSGVLNILQKVVNQDTKLSSYDKYANMHKDSKIKNICEMYKNLCFMSRIYKNLDDYIDPGTGMKNPNNEKIHRFTMYYPYELLYAD